MRFTTVHARILLALIIAFCIPVIAAIAADDAVDWDQAPPSVIHQKLWEGKVASRIEKNFVANYALNEADVTQTNYDVLFYDIFIRVNDTTEILYGDVKFVALAAEDGVTSVQVDFYDNMIVDSIIAPSGELGYTRSNNVVTVIIDATYNTGEQFEFDFYYHGHPTEGGFQAFSFDIYNGVKMISSLSEPYFARTWWPCKDRMDDKADSFNIAIEVDTTYYVASNGTLDSTVISSANTHTFYYSVRYPMVTYLFSVAIHAYTVWYDEWVYNSGQDTMPIVNAVFPLFYTYSLPRYGITPQALTIFSDQYGLYPFTQEKYGHANFTWGGGMEHQTMTSMAGSSFGFSEPVVVHELSHQWWGDMITCESWQDIWLNEGWASYSEALYYLEKDGWASYHDYMNDMASSSGGTSGGTIYIQDTTDVWGIFSARSYDKGAWVVHMLRGVLGDSLFFEGVHSYYNSQYQYASATTEDFKNVFEAATGVELDWFFDEWIHGEYRPNYNWSYWSEVSDSTGYDVYVYVEQIQTTNPQVFIMPVDFYVTGPNDTLTLQVDKRRTRFKLNFPVDVTGMSLDPMNWVLKYETQQLWHMHIITLNDELDNGVQYLSYKDSLDYRGGTGPYTWTIDSGSLPSGYSLDNRGIISGVTPDTGYFTFTVALNDMGTGYTDVAEYTIYIAPGAYVPGDVDGNGVVNVADLTYLVAYMFSGGPAPGEINSADVDGSCDINVNDITYLVSYLFGGGPDPLAGCVSK